MRKCLSLPRHVTRVAELKSGSKWWSGLLQELSPVPGEPSRELQFSAQWWHRDGEKAKPTPPSVWSNCGMNDLLEAVG